MRRLLVFIFLFVGSCERPNFTVFSTHYYRKRIEINDPIALVYRNAQFSTIDGIVMEDRSPNQGIALLTDSPGALKFVANDQVQVTWDSAVDGQYYRMDTSNIGIQIWLEKRADESIFLMGQLGAQELYRPIYWFQKQEKKGSSISKKWHFRYQEHLSMKFSDRLSQDFNAGLIYGLELNEGDTLHTIPGAIIYERE